jgi:tRNA (mo5U34)-methyltransferase
MTPDELRAEVARIRWFHRIDLGHGIVTPGEDRSARKLRTLRLPDSLAGRTVLDVGAWDGFFSFEAERRGAARVVAVDPFCWRAPAWGPDGWGTQQGFALARRALGSRVEDADVDLEELGRLGTFDVVLFLGVLYHLPDPWPVLKRVAAATGGLLVLETHVDLLDVRRPAAAFYPGAELAGDPSNWWGPNVALLEAKLRAAGFGRLDVVHRERLPYRAARAAYRRLRPPPVGLHQGRCVIHAHR